MFARAYAPSKLEQVMKHWEEALKQSRLPFQPENINNLEGFKEILEEGVLIEKELNEKFYSNKKEGAEQFETIKESYLHI